VLRDLEATQKEVAHGSCLGALCIPGALSVSAAPFRSLSRIFPGLGNDPLPAAFWSRDIGSAIGNLADLSPSSQTTFMVAWVILALLMLVGRPVWMMLSAFVYR
jgi:hypothetical protein